MHKAFPLRTLLLMIAALIAFGRLWCATHPGPDERPGATRVQVLPMESDGGVGGDR